jgi:hypothetical protein
MDGNKKVGHVTNKGGGGLNIHFFPIFLCVQEEYVK